MTTTGPIEAAETTLAHYELAVFAQADAAALALAKRIAQHAANAIAARGVFRIALAGGSTPRRTYELLATPELAAGIAWSRVHVFFGDERCVPAGDAASNAHMAREVLLDRVPIPKGNVHAIDGAAEPAAAAAQYAALLGDERLDCVLLGMGDDGHTASLFPGGPELAEREALVVPSTAPCAPSARITLTRRALDAAREVIFLAVGPTKAPRLAQVLRELDGPADDATLPAAQVRPSNGRLTWFVDRAAMGEGEGQHATGLADFGMIGLAVMGRNLALNIADHGFEVAVWNLEPELTQRAVGESEGRLRGTVTLSEFVASLERPRRIMMMIRAGAPVDAVLDALEPLLDPGDVVIDGGNSWFEDTRRREQRMARQGVRFVGVGVSGGEEGARNGPSLMPGGDKDAYERIRPVLEAIAARTEHGACVTHIGADGAGHFVKMVHNGIEYADMQFIAEAYQVLTALLGFDPPALAKTFREWNEGALASFLIEITAQIFERKDDRTDGWLVDQVLDKAGQKGTGKWTAQVALDLGVSVPSIAAAIDARVLSSMKRDRERYAPLLAGPQAGGRAEITVTDVRDALLAAKVGAYAQGMALIAAGAAHYGWEISPKEIARIWTGGCIIRAKFLETMMHAWEQDPALPNLLIDPAVRADLDARQSAWRRVVAAAVTAGVPVPGMAASLAYYDALRTARLPQNLVQAQRDAFGAHTYQRVDDPDGEAVHSEWLSD
ncbi:MAG: NADP-dependent phosphogluconate dehydrogenase [Planctomycetota bacterium]